jgi:hypothetical protein
MNSRKVLSYFNLNFPEDTSKLVELLNKESFQGFSDWDYNPNGIEVFSNTSPVKHLSAEFVYDQLLRYLECKQILADILLIVRGEAITIRVSTDYKFVIVSSVDSKVIKNNLSLQSTQMIKFLQDKYQNLLSYY